MLTKVTRDGRSIIAEPSKCAGCITCVLRCSFIIDNKFNLSRSRIQVDRQVARDNEFEISFTAACDACLICARYCPYGALIALKEKKAEQAG
jgi:Fe-S-cluster-containing dehydrogenase component